MVFLKMHLSNSAFYPTFNIHYIFPLKSVDCLLPFSLLSPQSNFLSYDFIVVKCNLLTIIEIFHITTMIKPLSNNKKHINPFEILFFIPCISFHC